jgi:hypothetical protein
VSDADSSAAYAIEVARMLWPPPWAAPYVTRGRAATAAGHRDAYLFPGPRRPRLLLPVDVPASAVMLHRLGAGRGLVGPRVRAVLERSVRSRAFAHSRWPVLRIPATGDGGDSIESYLSGCLGAEVRVGVMLGTRRVNQKPVLPVFDRDGRLRGYAKVGHNDLTRTLVAREAAALGRLHEHDLRRLRVPRVLHHGRWGGLEVLVVSPLTTDPRAVVTPAVRAAAARELAHLDGVTPAALAGSAFWRRLVDGAEQLRARPDGARLVDAVRRIEAEHGGDAVRLGCWHGDWGAWNMGLADGVLHVWDWERFDPQVPVGFDGLHFAAQSVRPGDRDAARQEDRFLASVRDVLLDTAVPPAEHGLTLRLYLLEMGIRYVDALTHGSTPALRRRTSWVLQLSERLAERPLVTLAPEGRP